LDRKRWRRREASFTWPGGKSQAGNFKLEAESWQLEAINMDQINVLILMGSDSDAPVMQAAADILRELGVSCDMTVASAHRSPERVMRLVREAPARGVKIFIVGAGAAAHLAGVVAAHTTSPVIGVPIDSSALKGLDALLSTVQMPPGVPVATVSIGKAGATNAGVLAAQILAVSEPRIAARLDEYKRKLADKVEAAAEKLKQ
jgi:phosphoribosylamine---glycine ligase